MTNEVFLTVGPHSLVNGEPVFGRIRFFNAWIDDNGTVQWYEHDNSADGDGEIIPDSVLSNTQIQFICDEVA